MAYSCLSKLMISLACNQIEIELLKLITALIAYV